MVNGLILGKGRGKIGGMGRRRGTGGRGCKEDGEGEG